MRGTPPGSLDEVRDAVETLRRHCAAIGRDIGTIEMTLSFPIVLRDDAGAARDRLAELLDQNGVPIAEVDGFLAGSPAEVADAIRPYLELGFETVIVRMPAPYDRETIERMPEVGERLER